MGTDEWDEEFSDFVKKNTRSYAGYFSCKQDRQVAELAVVEELSRTLAKSGRAFFHSLISRTAGTDPPDCEALSSEGDRIGIEVTELVDEENLAAAMRNSGEAWSQEPMEAGTLIDLVQKGIRRKGEALVQGGPYGQYVLVFHCDDPRILDHSLIERLRSATFGASGRPDRAFLIMSYCPVESCCPVIELKLNQVTAFGGAHTD